MGTTNVYWTVIPKVLMIWHVWRIRGSPTSFPLWWMKTWNVSITLVHPVLFGHLGVRIDKMFPEPCLFACLTFVTENPLDLWHTCVPHWGKKLPELQNMRSWKGIFKSRRNMSKAGDGVWFHDLTKFKNWKGLIASSNLSNYKTLAVNLWNVMCVVIHGWCIWKLFNEASVSAE